ncbi:cytochrome P450 [Panus rudis PR-1116 ss-1]|nr:cytochrome P450 [Panus rudis PR-1116 ss-1]
MFNYIDVSVCVLMLEAYVVLLVRRRNRSKGLPYPPGPKGLPLVGNINDVPRLEPYVAFKRWSQEYNSDIIRLHILGKDLIVINTVEIARDLFEKRSAIYSDRPDAPMLNDLVGFGWGTANVHYGEDWRAMRRAFHQVFSPEKIKKYMDTNLESNRDLLVRLVDSPERFLEHFRHTTGRIIMRIAYGIDIEPEDDPYILIAERAIEGFAAAGNSEGYLVDFFPILKHVPAWFPGAAFKRQGNYWKPFVTAMLEKPFNHVKEQMRNGALLPECIATTLLEGSFLKNTDTAWREGIVKSSLASMYAGGADTTVSSLSSFMLAMTLNPEIQKKAQKEIDKVLGTDRLPDYSDIDSLPYVDAIVNESLRWHPVLPLAVYHRLQEDDVYNDYFLPKGSFCIGNSWAILHDESVYPDPLSFNPDRYFDENGKRNPNVPEPSVAFGFGRRICPGRHFAMNSFWINVVTILAAFEISRAVDENGKEIVPKEEYEPGLLMYPKPFRCRIRPRSAEYERMIRLAATETLPTNAG